MQAITTTYLPATISDAVGMLALVAVFLTLWSLTP